MSDRIFYLLWCRECGDPEHPLPIPFGSAVDRGHWAAGHTKATGHDNWLVRDEPAPPDVLDEMAAGMPLIAKPGGIFIDARHVLLDSDGLRWVADLAEKFELVGVTNIARVVHAANSAWQAITGDEMPSPPWDSAPAWQRESALDGVRAVLAGASPEQLHESWCEGKRAAGWVFGPVKDPDAKTHPCLVPYASLPEFQRVKDRLFAAIVGALAGEPDAAPVSRPRPGWGQACDHPLDGHVSHGPWCPWCA